MKDSRFTTSFAGVTDLLDGVDIDDVDDIETMLVVLLDRQVTVVLSEDASPTEAILVTVWLPTVGHGSLTEFPTSVAELALDGARLAVEAGPYEGRASSVQAGADLLAMDEDDFITALQQALGMTRLYNATYDD